METLGDFHFKLRLSIGGIAVAINCNSEWLEQQLRLSYQDYLVENEPLLTASIRWRGISQHNDESIGEPMAYPELRFDILATRLIAPDYEGWLDLKSGEAGLDFASMFPIQHVDIFIRIIYSFLVFRSGGIMIHGAGIVDKGKTNIFFGHSGSGKTTISRLSRERIILNDDLLILLPVGDIWKAYSTPFWNPTQVKPCKQNAPIAGFYRLLQDKTVYLEKMSPSQATAELVAHIPQVSGCPWLVDELIPRCEQLQAYYPVQYLHFLPDDSFWALIDNGG